MKQKRERKHNFIEVENEITYGVNSKKIKSRKPNPLSSFHNRYCLSSFGDLCQPQNLISFCSYDVLKIIKMNCNALTFQQ